MTLFFCRLPILLLLYDSAWFGKPCQPSSSHLKELAGANRPKTLFL